MGLCLYLALMKHIVGDNFTFAVLDDVMMSVDIGHRRELRRLLKHKFPQTQFIITTHDRIWLHYMKTEGLVRKSMTFGGWNVDTGPRVWEDKDVWCEIKLALDAERITEAAAILRRYLEYMAAILADNLRAKVEFRGDASYDLGDLLSSVCSQWKDRLEKGIKVAKGWKQDETAENLQAMLDQAENVVAKFFPNSG
jgi:hypothetical protein